MKTNPKVEKDLETIKTFINSFFYSAVSTKCIIKKDLEIVLLSPFDRDYLVKSIYVAKGYIRVGKKTLPLEIYYKTRYKELAIYIGHTKVKLTMDEIENWGREV